MANREPHGAQAQLTGIIAALDNVRRRLARHNGDLKLEITRHAELDTLLKRLKDSVQSAPPPPELELARRKSSDSGAFIAGLQAALKQDESSLQALQSECDFLRWTLEKTQERPQAAVPAPQPEAAATAAAADTSAERARLQSDLSAVKAQLTQVLAQLEIEKGRHAAKLAQAQSSEAAMEERFQKTLHDALRMAAENLERAGRQMEADKKNAPAKAAEPETTEPAVMSYEELSSFKDDLNAQMKKIAERLEKRGDKEQERLKSLAETQADLKASDVQEALQKEIEPRPPSEKKRPPLR